MTATHRLPSAEEHYHALVFLRGCLDRCGLEHSGSLWLAEARTLGELDEWAPLLQLRRGYTAHAQHDDGAYFDIAKQSAGGQWPKWYQKWFAIYERHDVPSVYKFLRERIRESVRKSGSLPFVYHIGPPDAIDVDENGGRIGPALEQWCPQLCSVENFKADDYHTTMASIANYYDDEGVSRGAFAIYPQRYCILLVPVFLRTVADAVRVVAIYTLILEWPTGWKEAEWPRKVAGCVNNLFVFAQSGLRSHFANTVVGWYPASGPLVSLLHPAWTNRDFLEAARLSGGLHEVLPQWHGYKIAGTADDPEVDGEVYAATEVPARVRHLETIVQQLLGEDGVGHDCGNAGDKEYGYLCRNRECWRDAGNERESVKKAVRVSHRLLKALYAFEEGSSVRPAQSYALDQECRKILTKLIDNALRDMYPETPKDRVNAVDCVGEAEWTLPVVPGTRFVVPWLFLLKRLPVALIPRSDVRFANVNVCRVDHLIGSSVDSMRKTLNGTSGQDLVRSVEAFLGGCSRNNWLLVRLGVVFLGVETEHVISKTWDQMRGSIRGWRRALMQEGRRRGSDTAPFVDVMRCNLNPAVRDAGLSLAGSWYLEEPLEGNTGIELEIWWRTSEKRRQVDVFVGVSWQQHAPTK